MKAALVLLMIVLLCFLLLQNLGFRSHWTDRAETQKVSLLSDADPSYGASMKLSAPPTYQPPELKPARCDTLSKLLNAAMADGNPTIHLVNLQAYNPFFMFVCSNCSCDICEQIKARGYWSPVETLIFHYILSRARCQENDALVVDVGAHVGYFSLISAAYGCRVTAFEPNSMAIKYLQASTALNSFSQVKLYPKGVGQEESLANYRETDTWALNSFEKKRRQLAEVKHVEYSSDSHDSLKAFVALTDNSIMTIVKAFENNQTSTQKDNRSSDRLPFHRRRMLGEVEVTKLDTVINETVLLLKIDTEGYEVNVIAGGKKVLSHHKVQNVLVEVKYANQLSKRDLLWRIAVSGGFNHVYNWDEWTSELKVPFEQFKLQDANIVDVTDIVVDKRYSDLLQFQDFWFSRERLPWL